METSLIKEYTGRIITYKESLRLATEYSLKHFPNVFIIGQGVTDHKEFFGSLTGLYAEYGPERFIESPLSEDVMTGLSIGAALNGLYPIQTHLRVDFVLLCMNQIVNLLAKYKYMFGGLFSAPTLIRLVIGRSWGQGGQHSQSFQSLFGHIPGLTVIMPSSAQSILESYPYIVSSYNAPVISIEHRLLYDIKYDVRVNKKRQNGNNPLTSYLVKEGKDITIVATSIMVLEALRAADYLEKQVGINCEIIDLNCISHPDKKLIIESIKKTGKLIVADTSWQAYGVGAEICRIVAEECPQSLTMPVKTLGMQPSTCPTAKVLEDYFYPNLEILTDWVIRMVTGKKDHGITLPAEHSMRDVYKKFKGPF